MPTTIATELRTAAEKLRTLATGAAHEDRTRWEIGHTLGSKTRVVLDNHERPTVLIDTWAQHREHVDDYLATFASPAVALAVADWLTEQADLHDFFQRANLPAATPAAALTVAHAINGPA